MNSKLQKLIAGAGPIFYNHAIYYYLHLRKLTLPPLLNLRQPATFNDKLIYLKCHYTHPQATLIADKLAVRDYVRTRIGGKYLVPLIGVYRRASDIDPSRLPTTFVIKPNHGSGWVKICRNKDRFDWTEAIADLDSWMSQNYYDIGLEYQYRDIERRLLVEHLLEGSGGDEVPDVKVFCFDGEPRFIQIDTDRHTKHRRSFYDTEWSELPFSMLYPRIPHILPRPDYLDEGIEIARVLSTGFPHVRIDLYASKEGLYFGEMTLHHGGGFEPIIPRRYAGELGRLITLPSQ